MGEADGLANGVGEGDGLADGVGDGEGDGGAGGTDGGLQRLRARLMIPRSSCSGRRLGLRRGSSACQSPATNSSWALFRLARELALFIDSTVRPKAPWAKCRALTPGRLGSGAVDSILPRVKEPTLLHIGSAVTKTWP